MSAFHPEKNRKIEDRTANIPTFRHCELLLLALMEDSSRDLSVVSCRSVLVVDGSEFAWFWDMCGRLLGGVGILGFDGWQSQHNIIITVG